MIDKKHQFTTALLSSTLLLLLCRIIITMKTIMIRLRGGRYKNTNNDGSFKGNPGGEANRSHGNGRRASFFLLVALMSLCLNVVGLLVFCSVRVSRETSVMNIDVATTMATNLLLNHEQPVAPPPSQKHAPGLYSPHTKQFSPIPAEYAKMACISSSEVPVQKVFASLDWTVRTGSAWPCHGRAALLWKKFRWPVADFVNASPWQRPNWLPGFQHLNDKALFMENLRDYYKNHQAAPPTQQQQHWQPFVPETYVLYRHADVVQFLDRLDASNGGMSEPWFIKMTNLDNGEGLRLLGPNSESLQALQQILSKEVASNENNHHLRHGHVPQISNTTLDTIATDIVLGEKMTKEKANAKVASRGNQAIIQSYIRDILTYQGRKFDLRMYFLVASVDPLVVFYHDGHLRISPGNYSVTVDNYNSTASHLTNFHASEQATTAMFTTWGEYELKQHVAANPQRFVHRPTVARDPLQHVRNEIKSALATLMAATRDHAFVGYEADKTGGPQNGFALVRTSTLL